MQLQDRATCCEDRPKMVQLSSGAMDAMVHDLAAFLALGEWSDDQKDMFKTSREACRSVVNHCGVDHDTACLVNFWVLLTKLLVVSTSDLPSLAIGLEGMNGMPSPPSGLGHLKALNVYRKKYLKQDIETGQHLCDVLLAHVDALWLSPQASGAESFLQQCVDCFGAVLDMLETDA